MTDKTAGELFEDLRCATEDYRAAEKEASFARNAACDALNRVNAAQRAVDAHAKALLEGAPENSNWGQRIARNLSRVPG